MTKKELIQQKKAVLDSYKENNTLTKFKILHMYPEKGIAYPNGRTDAKFFRLIGYNTDHKQKRDLGIHDEVRFYEPDLLKSVSDIAIFVDGSTIINFRQTISIRNITFQTIEIETEKR